MYHLHRLRLILVVLCVISVSGARREEPAAAGFRGFPAAVGNRRKGVPRMAKKATGKKAPAKTAKKKK
ncbi:MAG: hypothetical protein C4295_05370 [Candidatus Fervidibacterota bacterium]